MADREIARNFAQAEAEQAAYEAHAVLDGQTELILAFGFERYMAEDDNSPSLQLCY